MPYKYIVIIQSKIYPWHAPQKEKEIWHMQK